MKVVRALALILVGFIVVVGAGYCEVIYTKDGEQVQGRIIEITEDTIWVEIPSRPDEEITEYIEIDKSRIEKILNDDGSKYNYPQTDKK
jgi:hypothetical protein